MLNFDWFKNDVISAESPIISPMYNTEGNCTSRKVDIISESRFKEKRIANENE
jgi:hypothetical protein